MVPSLQLSFIYAASWRRCCHRPTDDAERCRGSQLALFWHTDFGTTCSEDTATINRPPALLHAPLASPPHLPSSRRPPYRQHVYQRQCRLLGQAAVLHTPQPGGPRDRKGTLDITPGLTLGIPQLETGRTSGLGSGDDTKDNTSGHRQGTTTDRVDSPMLPFPASLNKSDGTQQLTRSVQSAMSDILMRCDDRCTKGVRAPAWVTGWTHPLKLTSNRATQHLTGPRTPA